MHGHLHKNVKVFKTIILKLQSKKNIENKVIVYKEIYILTFNEDFIFGYFKMEYKDILW